MHESWRKAQEWEGSWWGNCCNVFGEEYKQLLYADRMGLEFFHDGKSPYNIDLRGKSVIDIGGGPSSLLLKCVNFSKAAVVDPMPMPDWVIARYVMANIAVLPEKGESLLWTECDECWVYNVLQHTEDPALVIKSARRAALIRIFEWIDTPVNVGHLHTLTEAKLNEWLGGEGKVEMVNQNNCRGKAYYGIFTT